MSIAVEEDSRFEYHESSPPNSKNYSCVTPDVILYSKTSIAADIDGDCYASTYETNGQIHFYQELSETNPRARTMSTAMSYEVINQRLDLPLRMAKSSDSLSRCRLTVPNLPTPAYTEIVKNASKKNALGYSCPDIRKNVMSLPQTPEITIVSCYFSAVSCKGQFTISHLPSVSYHHTSYYAWFKI